MHEALVNGDCCVGAAKVRLSGLTGRVAFDRRGYRTDYQLAVIELRYNTLPRKVSHFTLNCFLLVLLQYATSTSTNTSSSSSGGGSSAMATTT